MNKCVIIVEGVADAVFINDLLYILLPTSETRFEQKDSFKIGKKIQINNSYDLNILIAGGCTNINKYKKQIEGYNDDGYKVLMLQDADSELKDNHHGGVSKRLAYLNDIKQEYNIEFETFLFPNSTDDGTLESLLLSIAPKVFYDRFFACYKKYSICVENINDVNSKEILEPKYLVFNYCQVFQGNRRSNEKERIYTNQYWELENENLKPLRDFLIREINIK